MPTPTDRAPARALLAAVLGLTLVGGWSGAAAAAPFDDAMAAYRRGDYATAMRLWRSLADQGDAPAQYTLGMVYDDGLGVPPDRREAVQWYRKAADQGYAWAQYVLGAKYTTGDGVPLDYREAAKWYGKAAEQGNAGAARSLGVMYENGRGVPQDYKEAVKWFRLAAEQGNTNAQNNLGMMYDTGRGVPQDLVRAHMWFNLAAAGSAEDNSKSAVTNRNRLAAKMTPAQLDEAQDMARKCQASGYRQCD